MLILTERERRFLVAWRKLAAERQRLVLQSALRRLNGGEKKRHHPYLPANDNPLFLPHDIPVDDDTP